MGLASPIRDGGAFTVLQVPPGAYTLTARVGGGFGPRRRDGGEEAEVAALPIVVSGEDLVGLRVVTNRGLTVPGVLVAEGGTLPTGSPVRIAAQAADPEMMMMGARPVEVGADGRFVIEGLLGEVQVTTMNLARGWMVKSISYRGADVTDKPFEPASDGGTLRIVVTNRITVVTGTVSGDNGGALTDYELIIFPADEARWTNLGRAMRVIRPDQYGVFRAESLPPGDYLVAAFDSLDEEARTNPEFLERVRPLAQDVRLTEGQTRTVTLKLSSPLQ
jgi:hypothetical protein